MDYLERFQEKITGAGIKSNINYMSMRLVQKMSSYYAIDADDPIFDNLINLYVDEIKLAEEARHRKLKDNEIDGIIDKLERKFKSVYKDALKKRKEDLIAKS